MPIQVPRARANRMTNKELNKVQNEVKKASEKTLTGAIKTWCQLFKSGKEINEILKENEIKVDKSIVPALVNLAKDKEVVIQLCKEILPRVNNTFCAYKEVEREYYDKNDPKRYIIGGTYCIFFIYVWAYLSLEEALGIDVYYVIDTQLIILFGCNFKIVVTYCIFYGISYIFRTYFVLWIHGV